MWLFALPAAFATPELRVDPADEDAWPTVAAAVAAAPSPAIVTIAAGTYEECLDTAGKQLALVGEGAVTLRASAGCGNVIAVHQGEQVNLRGLSISNPAGRGVYVYGSTVELDTVSLEGSTCAGCWGGGLYGEGSSLLLRSVVFSGNSADYGGGLFVNGGSVEVDGASFLGNRSAYDGGGFELYNGATGILRQLEVTGNEAGASGGGGAVTWYSSTSFEEPVFYDNVAAGNGGALLYYATYTSQSIGGGGFSDNLAGGGGGAIEAEYNNDLDLYGVHFEGNSGSGYGGALANWYYGDLRVRDCTFADNSSTGAYGGALFEYPADGTTGDLHVASSTFVGNAAAGDGGAIWTGWVGEVSISDNLLAENRSVATGGGMLVYVSDTVALSRNTFCGNEAGYGGGVSVQWTNADTWTNNQLIRNHALQGGGASRYAVWAGEMTHNTFAANSADDVGGAYWVSWAYATFRDNLVTHTGGGHGIWTNDNGAWAAAELGYDGWHQNLPYDGAGFFLVEPGVDGHVAGDPLYVADPATLDCRSTPRLLLGTGSPYRDAGDPALSDPDGTRSDIGAFGGPGAPVLDWDGDGADTTADCDDTNVDVGPGAAEVCDGLDNDCDGVADPADAEDASTWYADADEDGHGDPDAAVRACEAPEGHVATGDDCDDADHWAWPGAWDAPGDGIDQDCDGADAGWPDTGEPPGDDTGEGDKGGCACSSGAPAPAAWLLPLLVLALRRRVRR